MIGIVSYGFYIPKYRITTEEIAKQWEKNPRHLKKSLMIDEKAVAARDEDTLTMAFESASMALKGESYRKDIGCVFVGSENHPYAVNPTSTILADYLGIGNNYLASDTQFACKAATGAMLAGLSLVKSRYCNYSLIVGSDKATGKPGDPLEYTASSASASFVLGKKDVILEYVNGSSYSSDTPDFWRREGKVFPSHAGRFTGKPGYFDHITSAVRAVMKKAKKKPSDFSYIVFHMPNGKYPKRIAQALGFTKDQLIPSLTITKFGNPYTACALIGLCAVLEIAQKNDLILLASYGSGAGSDAFVFRVTSGLKLKKKAFRKVNKHKTYINYTTYLKFMNVI